MKFWNIVKDWMVFSFFYNLFFGNNNNKSSDFSSGNCNQGNRDTYVADDMDYSYHYDDDFSDRRHSSYSDDYDYDCNYDYHDYGHSFDDDDFDGPLNGFDDCDW